MRRLFPITRSITGNGNRETLRLLQELVPLTIHEVPSGAPVYDWMVPDEWNIADAWIADRTGRRIVDFRASNLHVVSYSEPVRATLTWHDLEPRLHRHQQLPDAIPYRTSYYRRTWGFCVTAAQYEALAADGGPFDVGIDATLAPGALTYGELLIPGRSAQEILLSCYICHPSMANDSLSGVVLTAMLARELAANADRYYSYRVVFVPETIGALAYLALNERAMQRIDVGLVVTTVGGPGRFSYKQSWQPNHAINRLVEATFREAGLEFITYPFDVHGSDERQYSSQAFGINVATVCRDRYYEYPQYHTSLDNLELVTGAQLAVTFDVYCRLLRKLDARQIYRSRVTHGEPMLSRRGLYPADGGAQRPERGGRAELDLLLWVAFLCDGRRSLDDVALELGVAPEALEPSIQQLMRGGVLERV
jgi:aminopeptidase-like protein